MWDKIAKLGIQAGKAYIATRGVDGAIEDAHKVLGWAKKGADSLFSSNTCGETDELPRLDFEKVQQWTDDCISEMNDAFCEAKHHDITSLEFCQNANIALYTGYNVIVQMMGMEDEIDGDDFDILLSNHITPIDNLCDQIFMYIGQKCTGSMNPPADVRIGGDNGDLCMQVYGVYPVNFTFDMTMLVAVITNGIIKPGCTITLPDNEGTLAEVAFLRMFGKVLSEASYGDLCCVALKGDYTDALPNDRVFQIGLMPHPSECQVNTSDLINASEKEYLDKVKTILEVDGVISASERRLLDKLRSSLGISEARAIELETIASEKNVLTDSEKEYLDEYKACLKEDGVISASERRLLDRLRNSLGISEARAAELETIASEKNVLTDSEKEYLDEYKSCRGEDGVISASERRLLDRLAKSLDITQDRIREIEACIS